jgi:ribose/xylose/arabinose/galactoside ABC-type transport system permease subunit
MIVQEFDLSVGSVFTFCTFEYATLLLNFNVQPVLALVIVLISGTLIGMLNGAITFGFRIPAIIVTLGTMYFWRGLTLVLSGGLPVSFVGATRDKIPFKSIFVGNLFGIPDQFLWFLALAVIFEVVLYRHKLGNRMMAVGGNDAAAGEMGIKIRTTKLICFTLTGLLVAFCAILQTSRIYEGSARLGVGYEFYAIAAVVIGGTSIKGGSGTAIGTVAGALILQSVGIGLAVMGISGYYIDVFVGAVIILVMALNAFVGKRRR